MAALPAAAAVDPTLAAVQTAVEARAAADAPRRYLGMSSIGQPCERRLWYSFRLAVREQFDAPTLWRFEDGFRCEDVMANRLRLVPGVHLRTVDPRTGEQFGFADLGGHFKGHADGLVTGLLQAPKALHVWEAKAVNEAKLGKLAKLKAAGEKAALKQWDAVYWAQAVLYMAYADAPRHYLTASSPGAREMVSVRTDSDLDAARRLREKAQRIIAAPEPLPKISADPAWYECKLCPAHALCHGNGRALVNCRTCVHATPELDGDGRWSCARSAGATIPDDVQRTGCEQHRLIPALVTLGKQVDASADENWIEYELSDGRRFRNGAPGADSYTSEELRHLTPGLVGDAITNGLRVDFDARLVEAA